VYDSILLDSHSIKASEKIDLITMLSRLLSRNPRRTPPVQPPTTTNTLFWIRCATTSTTNHIKGTGAAPGVGPIGQDGRHELWREGIYDHDNEPKYVLVMMLV
jgi:hypothetical protein